MSSILPPKKNPLALIGGAITGALATIAITRDEPRGAGKVLKIAVGAVTGALVGDKIHRDSDPRTY